MLSTAVGSPEELQKHPTGSFLWPTQGWRNWNISLQPGMLATPVPSMHRPKAHHAFVSPWPTLTQGQQRVYEMLRLATSEIWSFPLLLGWDEFGSLEHRGLISVWPLFAKTPVCPQLCHGCVCKNVKSEKRIKVFLYRIYYIKANEKKQNIKLQFSDTMIK